MRACVRSQVEIYLEATPDVTGFFEVEITEDEGKSPKQMIHSRMNGDGFVDSQVVYPGAALSAHALRVCRTISMRYSLQAAAHVSCRKKWTRLLTRWRQRLMLQDVKQNCRPSSMQLQIYRRR